MPKANQAQFHFFCGNIKPDTFEIAEFSGIERIGGTYSFDITLISRDETVSCDELIGLPSTLFICREGEYYPWSGIVSKFSIVDKSTDYVIYNATLVPHLWIAGLNVQSRIFQKMTVEEIIKTVLDENGIGNYQFKLQKYPQQEYVVQYQESDLNFISRLMENAGIWYYFRKSPLYLEEMGAGATKEKLVITDNPSEFCDIPGPGVVYRPLSGFDELNGTMVTESIYKLKLEKHLIPGTAMVRNYNYRSPEVELVGKKVIEQGKQGIFYEYGGDCRKSDEVQRAADILSRRILSQQVALSGCGNCRLFRAGHRFTLKEHFRGDLNTNHLISEVIHTGGHPEGNEVMTYKNEFRCIPGDTASFFAPQKMTSIPKVNGILTGMIESNDSEYAHLDEFGRYKVRLPFDASGKKNDCSGSKYIRLAQPCSGAQYGIHFPSRQGAEVVIACIDGDPSKPLGLGTIPNANTVPPVVGTNKHQNIIRTAGGNELLMDDDEGKQRVRIVTKEANCLEMDDGNRRVFLQSKDGNKLLIDDTGEVLSCNAGKNVISMSYKSGQEGIVINTSGGHIIRIDDSKQRVTIQSGAGHSIDLDDKGKTVTLTDSQGESSVILDGGSGLKLSTKGKMVISAQGDVEIKGANVIIGSASGGVDIKAAQDLSLNGLNINQKATVGCKIESLNLEAGGTASVKVNGGTTEIAGKASVKVNGMSAELSGSAMTSVKGGMVMIN